ncbi:MAG TPA: hypothetical protein PL075_01480 [Candidatus Paceibacterota bacterium]|nr:hypothetical protein [Candidatus Paceibacterota bacterium]
MIIKRSPQNPILKPLREHGWEAEATFNPCAVVKGKDIFLLYRAISMPHYHSWARSNIVTSDIGIAQSHDGHYFFNRKRFIVPEEDWERFGCEDPRVTKLNDKYYIFYTALSKYPFRAEGIKVGLAISKDLKNIQEKHLVTPFNAKAMALFPEKINGQITAILTVHTDQPPAKICLASFNKESDIWSEKFWNEWYKNFEKYALPLQRNKEDHIEVGAPPLKTKYGWLIFYSYIRNYFSPDRLFGIEAILLDLKNPSKILARTEYPILTAEEYYEKIGFVPNVVFPSGAFIKDNWIYLYYGGADTVGCLALIHLPTFFNEMLMEDSKKPKLERFPNNPILLPRQENFWEKKAVFNPGAIYLNNKVHLIYRAISEDNVSTFGYAQSSDGYHIDWRSDQPIYFPRESFEKRDNPNVSCGCEDPRLTKIGNKIYMGYTAFDGRLPRIALTSIGVKDFLNQQWQNWARPVLISPADLNDKDMVIFPEKFQGQYLIVHRVGYDIDYSFSKDLNFGEGKWLEENRWIYCRPGWWDSKKIGVAAPPLKTKNGWILFYHGISENNVYRVGAILLDLKNPIKILGRTTKPLLEPKMPYEKEGVVNNVVFPCGAVEIEGKVFIYYGGADRVVCGATINLAKLLQIFKIDKEY